jgi:subtilisin family serine protease
MIIAFQWAEVFRSLLPQSSGAASDMDIFLYPSGDPVEPISGSARFSKGADPVEIFSFYNDGSYDGNHDGVADTTFQLAIGQWGTTGTPALKYVMYQYGDRSKGTVTIDEYATHSGTCYGHANAAGAMTVAAAFYEQSAEYRDDPPVVEPFSSAGGTPILLDGQGNRIGAKTRSKPDITGPDGTSTTFFGSQTEDDRTGEQSRPSFFGTSAAAPHVAGVAALMLQARPNAMVDDIYTAMESTAVNMGAPGWDDESGYGLIRAADALLSLSGAQKVTVDAGTYANNGGVDTFRIVRSGSRLRFYINGTLGFDADASSIESIVVNGSNDADELIVDFSGGYIAPPISFNGGGGFNVLSEEGGTLDCTVHTDRKRVV